LLAAGLIEIDGVFTEIGNQDRSSHSLALWFRFSLVFSHQGEDPDRAVIGIEDMSLGGHLPESSIDRKDGIGHLFDQLPLGAGRQGNPEMTLQLPQPEKGHPVAILQNSHEDLGPGVILFQRRVGRQRSGQNGATAAAAKPVEFVLFGSEKRVAQDADFDGGLAQQVKGSLPAAGAGLFGLKVRMRAGDGLRGQVG
jgi:hypothetical protein